MPRISPSLLSQRLDELEHAGLVKRRKRRRQHGHTYHLTDAGRDLDGIVDSMAIWGQQWARDMSMEDLDPAFLAWSMHLRLNVDAMPPGRTVLQFEFSGVPYELSRFWLINTDGTVEMCLKHPGFDTDLLIESDLRLFVEAWRGLRDLRRLLRAGRIRLTGPRELRKAFPDMLLLSALSPYPRRHAGRERRLVRRPATGA